MSEPKFTPQFKAWKKKRRKDMQPLIELFPPGDYRIKENAPYAISAPNTVVELYSYGKMQVQVPVMKTYKDEHDVLRQTQVVELKWMPCVMVIVKAENKLKEAIDRENMLANEKMQSKIMDEIFTRAQNEITERLIKEIPQDYADVEENELNALDKLRQERKLTPHEEEVYKVTNEVFMKKQQEMAKKVTDGVKAELEKPEIKKPLLEEATKRMQSPEVQKEIKDNAEQFHKDNVVVQVLPEHLELIAISPKVLI